jgi:hypothetical protein
MDNYNRDKIPTTEKSCYADCFSCMTCHENDKEDVYIRPVKESCNIDCRNCARCKDMNYTKRFPNNFKTPFDKQNTVPIDFYTSTKTPSATNLNNRGNIKAKDLSNWPTHHANTPAPYNIKTCKSCNQCTICNRFIGDLMDDHYKQKCFMCATV